MMKSYYIVYSLHAKMLEVYICPSNGRSKFIYFFPCKLLFLLCTNVKTSVCSYLLVFYCTVLDLNRIKLK